jgi:thioredoxin-like negative regulator of GroEL
MLRLIATAQVELGRYDDARRNVDEASQIFEANSDKRGTPAYNPITFARVRIAKAERHMDDARRLLDDLVAAADPKSAARLHATKWLLAAEIAMETGNAENDVEDSLTKARGEIESSDFIAIKGPYRSAADLIGGESRLNRHDANGALPLLQRALAEREKFLVAPNPRLAEAQTLLALCYLETGRVTQAKELAASAAAIESHYGELSDRYRRPLKELQTQLQATTSMASPSRAQERN